MINMQEIRALSVAAAAGLGAYAALRYYSSVSRTTLRTTTGRGGTNNTYKESHRTAKDLLSFIKVEELWVYPIKSVGGFKADEVKLGATGFLFDREWCILQRNPNTDIVEVCAQDRFPKLRRANATILGKSGEEVLRVTSDIVCPDEPLMIPAHHDDQRSASPSCITVDLWGVPALVQEESPEANRWFSRIMETEVVLVRIVKQREPKLSAVHQGTSCVDSDRTALQDYCTLHMITQEGLNWLDATVSDGSVATSSQFRPNVVVSGAAFPEEDNWKKLSIGDISMRVGKLSGRCVTPTTRADGRRNPSFEPTKTLRKYRSRYHTHQVEQNLEKRNVCFMFGLDLFHDSTGTLKVGDQVTILEKQLEPVTFIKEAI